MGNFSKVFHTAAVVVLCGVLFAGPALAREFRFIAGEIAPDRAVWHPEVLMIEQTTDLNKDGLVFVLENPTSVEHEFMVPGMYQIVGKTKRTTVEDPDIPSTMTMHTLEPLRVKVGPKETKKVQVSTHELSGPREVGRHFRFFCPLHKDVHLGGSIYIVE
jgi:hypothetical protein